jgi:tRNA(Met) C34 N-acetyltransferase TmcA
VRSAFVADALTQRSTDNVVQLYVSHVVHLLSLTINNMNRGRGKSAAIGLCLAGAVAYGYSNIFVTAPSPENLGTVFEFVLKGFDLLKYTEHLDYEVSNSVSLHNY